MPGFNIASVSVIADTCASDIESRRYTSDVNLPSNVVETNRNYRYLWEIFASGVGDQDAPWQSLVVYAYKCTRPAPEFDEIVIHSGQDEIYRPGKNRWKPVDITFYETLGTGTQALGSHYTSRYYSDTARAIYSWWASGNISGGDARDSVIHIRNSSHGYVDKYLRRCRLAMVDAGGETTWEYDLLDCWPQKVTPSDLSYADTDIASINVTLRYAKAIENVPSGLK